jgi:hypothetical protein
MYWGKTITNENCKHEESKSGLYPGNACYHLVQNLLSSGLLSENKNITIYRIMQLPLILYEKETWSFPPAEKI